MKIQFACPSCGKQYSVDQKLAGKRAKCKQCGEAMNVPSAAEEILEADVVAPTPPPSPYASPDGHHLAQPAPRPPSPYAQPQATNSPYAGGQPAAPASPYAQPPAAARAPSGPLKFHPNLNQSLFPAQWPDKPERPTPELVVGDTFASNPGNVKVSKLRYARAYPKWFFIWHVGTLVAIGLCFLTLWVIPIAILFVLFVWLYWRGINGQFKYGCANPAKIVSLDPPLIAAFTDLSKGNCDTPVVKVCRQPIGILSTGAPQVGQQLATVAIYEDQYDETPHWSTFDPKPVACVSGNQQEILRVMQSFGPDDWKELEVGLAQIPKPIREGHFRIYTLAEMGRPGLDNIDQVHNCVRNFMHDRKDAKPWTEVDASNKQKVRAYVGNLLDHEIWCVLESLSISQMGQQGVALTAHGLFYNFKETGRGQIPWNMIVGGLCSNDGLEIMLRDGVRVLLPEAHFTHAQLDTFDVMLDTIGGRSVY